jgi:peroxiredoxin
VALKTLLPVLLTSLLLVGFRAPPEGSYQGVGSEAPDGGLVDLEGHARRLSEGAGGWTLLKFGTTWCPRCGEEVDELNKLAGDLQKMGVRVVEVFLRETGDVVRAHVKARPRAFRGLILVDAEGETIQAYGVSVIPRLFLVDPKGLVRLDSQFQDAGTLRQSLQRTLKAR